MQLFTSPTTPFGRKIMVLIHEFGLLDQISISQVSGNPMDPGTMPVAQNPLGKIPTLVLADGTAIYDSRVISRYLDAHFGLGVYPTGAKLWPVLTQEAAADGLIESAVLMAYEMRLRPAHMQFAPWTEGQWAKVSRALDMFAARAADFGAFDMPQIGLACALGYLDFRHDARGWRQGRENLAAWYAGIAARPSLLATQPPTA